MRRIVGLFFFLPTLYLFSLGMFGNGQNIPHYSIMGISSLFLCFIGMAIIRGPRHRLEDSYDMYRHR
jgi:hypothetical protein